ncbi:hypothetical protein [Lapillicoccus jejuensis]|uniref:Uncharacterized protein n=1 Tax=Lapillicoccus jejuensis TaxID=402171 RepID=A0A542DZN2_9MICO|nr:hypothetical protein [Lapillicoccus jejuensis]TQJ08538.1 hypothetical protein FB458_1628 [Lapillicoccus jejuensis]
MSLEEQLGMLRPAYEVESLVRAVVGARSVETARRGDCLSVSRPGASAPALQCYPAVVCVSLDPARAREVASASYVERVESKGVGTSYVWVPAARLQAGFDEALGLALEAVDRKARATTTSTPRQRTARVAAPVVPEKVPEVCPRCGVQISAAGTCFCD